MTCHCRSQEEHAQRAASVASEYARADAERYKKQIAERDAQIAAMQADPRQYEILDVSVHGRYLAVKVKYPSCTKCEFEGTKVMVFEDVSTVDAMKWKVIDPHFRPKKPAKATEAPGPVARFPGTDAGWRAACQWASFQEKR